jgi:hypothetical protein
MPYIDIVFQNIRSNSDIYGGDFAYYRDFPTHANASSSFRPVAIPGPSCHANQAAAVFLCESPGYMQYNHTIWPAVAVPGAIEAGLSPPLAGNKNCVVFPGPVPSAGTLIAPPPSGPAGIGPTWFSAGSGGGIHCLGTGHATLLGGAPPGSDRYALYFEAIFAYPGPVYLGWQTQGPAISGLFVHTKNTDADPGTQIAALCRRFPNAIIFGDLNLDIRSNSKRESLSYAIGNTHEILALMNSNTPYYTHYTRGSNSNVWKGSSTLDYALIPQAFVQHVELWGEVLGGTAPRLSNNKSDHAILMLRIECL